MNIPENTVQIKADNERSISGIIMREISLIIDTESIVI